MARRINFSFERDSVAAVVNAPRPSTINENNLAFERGMRGGVGAIVMPGITQYVWDNYFTDQTDTVDIGTPWTKSGSAVADSTYFLLDALSAKLGTGSAHIYQSKTLSAADATLSAYVFVPPPELISAARLYWEGSSVAPTGIWPLGDNWYFIWYTATAAGSAQNYGARKDTGNNGYIWVDGISLTQTSAPMGFVPNALSDSNITSSNDDLRYDLDQPLPLSGSIAFSFQQYYDSGDSIDTSPRILCFVGDGAGTDGGELFEIIVDSTGLYVQQENAAGGSTLQTTAKTSGVNAFEFHDIVVEWDFLQNGTKAIQIFVDGVLEIESTAFTEGMSTVLKDVWVGSERDTSANQEHFQGLIQDIEIYRRVS